MAQVKVTLVRSTIACLPKQKATVAALGISRSYVSRIEKTALNKIKNAFN